MATKREKIAEHALLDDKGNVVEAEESADGARYSLVGETDKVEWYYSLGTDDEKRMYALFGWKTLMTNITSQSRQNGRTSAADQMADCRERMDLNHTGKWLDRTREGFKPDPDLAVRAFAQTCLAQGKITQAQLDAGKLAEWTAKAASDPAWLKNVYALPDVKAAYATLAGKPLKSVDELM